MINRKVETVLESGSSYSGQYGTFFFHFKHAYYVVFLAEATINKVMKKE